MKTAWERKKIIKIWIVIQKYNFLWLRWLDSNQRPLLYQNSILTNWTTSHQKAIHWKERMINNETNMKRKIIFFWNRLYFFLFLLLYKYYIIIFYKNQLLVILPNSRYTAWRRLILYLWWQRQELNLWHARSPELLYLAELLCRRIFILFISPVKSITRTFLSNLSNLFSAKSKAFKFSPSHQ